MNPEFAIGIFCFLEPDKTYSRSQDIQPRQMSSGSNLRVMSPITSSDNMAANLSARYRFAATLDFHSASNPALLSS